MLRVLAALSLSGFFYLTPVLSFAAKGGASADSPYFSPIHLAVSPKEKYVYVVNATRNSISVINLKRKKVLREIPVGPRPVHATLSHNGRRLYVSIRHGGRIDEVDLRRKRVVRSIAVGPEPYGTVLSPDGKILYVVQSQADRLAVVDLSTGKMIARVPVGRDPRYAALSSDGTLLAVANGLGRSVTFIDVKERAVLETRDIGRASILRQLAFLPETDRVMAVHLLSHDEASALQMERGWIHSNGFSLMMASREGRYRTLLLDQLLSGAANPWGVVVSSDGLNAYVSLSGVHEVARIDLRPAIEVADFTTDEDAQALSENVELVHARKIAQRFPSGGEGPRGLALAPRHGLLLVANYFSDSVSVMDANTGAVRAVILLGSPGEPDVARRGEALFNDARLCYQNWFSCASCHQEDATVDALNWDLPNDGVGNFKNAKSLHDAHDTPPAMWTGVRANMNAAVAAGQRFLGFLPNEKQHEALMAFLAAPPRHPNYNRTLQDKESVARGKDLYFMGACAVCHAGETLEDGKFHDVGIQADGDKRSQFNTPSLRDTYRSAPYFHDGSAQTLEDVVLRHNPYGEYGLPKKMTEQQVKDLAAYLRTL